MPLADEQPQIHAPSTRARVAQALRTPRAAYRLPWVAEVTDGQRRRRVRALRLLGLDVLMLALALAADTLGAQALGSVGQGAGWLAGFTVLTLVLIARRGGYRFRLGVSPFEYAGLVVTATATAAAFVVTARVLFTDDPAPGEAIVRLWAFATAYLLFARIGFAIASQRATRAGLSTVIIGAGVVGQTIAKRLASRPEMGLRPIGYLDKEPLDEAVGGLPVLGASWDLERVAHEHGVEHVVVTFSTAPHHVLLALVRRCRALGLDVSVVPRLFEQVSNRITIEHVGGIPLLRVDQADPRGWQFEVKYVVERLVGVLALLVISPLLLGIAALVKLTSPGPVFFKQPRVGLDGREFAILKFRTMRVAPAGQEADAAWAARVLGADVPATPDEDDRRTPIGRFLRRWSLDELPQLLNIALGDMAIVGPRPERTGYVRAFESHVYRYGDRHRVKSGLTGWAQVHGLRGQTSLDDRVEWDNYYIENWSPWLDLKILMLTVPAVLGGAE